MASHFSIWLCWVLNCFSISVHTTAYFSESSIPWPVMSASSSWIIHAHSMVPCAFHTNVKLVMFYCSSLLIWNVTFDTSYHQQLFMLCLVFMICQLFKFQCALIQWNNTNGINLFSVYFRIYHEEISIHNQNENPEQSHEGKWGQGSYICEGGIKVDKELVTLSRTCWVYKSFSCEGV